MASHEKAYYVNIETINGESQAQGMTNYLEVDNVSWGASNPPDVGNYGLSGGKPSCNDFSFTCEVDSACYQIASSLYKGQHINNVTFKACKTGGGGTQYTYLTVTLTNCFLSNYAIQGGGSGLPVLSVSIAYQKIAIAYSKQDTASGAVQTVGTTNYDIAAVATS